MAGYATLQHSKDPIKRKSFLDKCIELEELSLRESRELKLVTLVPSILPNLLFFLGDRVDLEASPEKRKELFKGALMYGHDVEKLSDAMDPEVLSNCLVSLTHCARAATNILPKEQAKDLDREATDYCRRAVELAEKSGNKELLAKALLAEVLSGRSAYGQQWTSETTLAKLERAIALARETGNKKILGSAYTVLSRDLAFGTFARESDPKRLKRMTRKVKDLATRALKLHKITGDEVSAAAVYGVVLDVLYYFIAADLEKTYDKIIEAWTNQ